LPPRLAGRIPLPDAAQADPDRPPVWPGDDPGDDAAAGPDSAGPQDEQAEAAYRDWLPGWRIWATRARADAERRALHNTLHAVAARVAQEGDALELVLATGLLTWQPPDGPLIREHLLSTRVTCEIDPVSSDIRVRVPAGGTTRLGDGPLLDGLAGFRRERTNHLHERLHNRPPAPLGAHEARLLRDWLTLALDVPVDGFEPQDQPPPPPPPDGATRPRVTYAPALVLRVRDQASLLTYYERMLATLRGDGPPPLGLVQLVATLDAAERLAWLEAEGATSGAELGVDPLLPLPASPEQARVLERLRHDNGVVVEGPPGTGKTHTIANLISALLAEGQRVLVTSQKAQALRVLREKLPPELQRLCVSFTDAEDASVPTGGAGLGGLGSPVGSPELAASVSALAAEKAVYHPEALDRRIEQAARRRAEALRARAELADRARSARVAERAVHPDSEVGAAGWGGTRASIAARVRAGGEAHGWFPPPAPPAGSDGERRAPLTDAEAVELYSLLSTASKDAALPADRADVPVRAVPPILAAERFAALVTADRMARQTAEAARAGVATAAARGFLDEVAAAGSSPTGPLRTAVTALVRALDDLTAHGARGPAREWIPAALDDALAGRDRLLWAKVSAAAPLIAEAARHVDDLGLHSVALPSATTAPTDPARATGGPHEDGHREDGHREGEPGDAERAADLDPAALLPRAEALRAHLDGGAELRRRFRPKVQREADALLRQVTVDGVAPTTPELLDLVLTRLRAELAVEAAGRGWTLVGRPPRPGDPLEVRLSWLLEGQQAIEGIDAVVAARDRVVALAAEVAPGSPVAIDSAANVRDLAAAMAALEPMAAAAVADRALTDLADGYDRLATDPDTPAAVAAELGAVAAAAAARDAGAYAVARAALDAAVARRQAAARRAELHGRLRAAHPALADLLAAAAIAGPARPDRGPGDARSRQDGGGDPWPARLEVFSAAWAWAVAASWLARTRCPDGPANIDGASPVDLDARLDAAEDVLAAATAELAGAKAWKHCLERMGAEQSAALRAYADTVAAGGTLAGRHAERYRQAAREAMEIAQTAVPAWVMPIREVLSTIPAVRDSFDVVIVDEGSQAGLDSLFLLWLAPRVIVVGDDRQCTPPVDPAQELDPVLDRLDALLPDVPAWLRVGFTPRSSLFSLLRTRFGEVIRLREHFRCMPEIIEWSSAMFYRDAPLLPLRQFGADRLTPLVARFVPHGFTTATPAGPRNPAEAEALVAQVLACAEDPRYAGLSFGVVVTQGTAQATLIRDRLAERMSAAEHLRRRLRVGTPADFQGDERDVVFLSLVVAPGDQPVPLTRLEYQRRFNVAASRARDQVWLFHSVAPADLDHQDLRHSYLSYVLSAARPAVPLPGVTPPGVTPPGVTTPGVTPPLAEVATDRPHPAFGSLFEQRVFRHLAGRGYLVTPQVEVNGRRVDLVVTGGRARFAVECDGDVGPGPAEIAREFDRERELRRAGWRFWRVRQSDFELDPEAALASLWPRLAAAGIAPIPAERDSVDGRAAPGGPAAVRGPVRAGADELLHRWRPIALSELEGLDDAPTPAERHDPAGARRFPGTGVSAG
uniref:AAA domain-containing protein n=1 Tax=Frankia gtarii TaxID=2950102 RepID=UPI0021BDFA31